MLSVLRLRRRNNKRNFLGILIVYAMLILPLCAAMEAFLPSLLDNKRVINLRNISETDKAKQLMNLKEFSYLHLPKSCGVCKDGFLLINVVLSFVANKNNRDAIRETWGKPSNCINTVFFVGTTYDRDIMRNIGEESKKYNDLVQGNIEDNFRKMVYKHVMALKWVAQYCQDAKYVVKTNTDVIVWTDKLYKRLQNDTWGDKNLIAGYIEKHEKVLREHDNTKRKWRIVTTKEFPSDFYPPYCWGQFVIYSGDVVPKLLSLSHSTPFFKLEDIYVTGILAARIKGIRHVHLVPNYYLSRPMIDGAMNEKNTKNDFVYGPYSVTPQEIRDYWHSREATKSNILKIEKAFFARAFAALG